MVNYTIIAGGFTSFIATYLFDSDTNSLSLTQNTTTGQNPSWITLHPSNNSVLYAVNEIGPVGSIQSFLVGSAGELTLGDTVSTGGNGPTYTEFLPTGQVTGLNFGSPNMAIVPTDPNDPLRFDKDDLQSTVVAFPVVAGAPSNPHMSLQVGDDVLVPDLGADKIWRLRDDGCGFSVVGQITVDPGSGPRHIAFGDEILFTIHEKSNALTAQGIPEDPTGATLPLIANASIVPTDAPAGTKFAAAEILIHPTSNDTLIYVSNRNIGETLDERGDSVAIFRFVSVANETTTEPARKRMLKVRGDHHHVHRHLAQRQEPSASEGSLELVTQAFTGLQQIRGMLFSPDGKFLVASGNVGEAGVKVFEVLEDGQGLKEVASDTGVPTRTSFVFL